MFLLPTLNRPKLLEKCLNSMTATMSGSPGKVLIDENDPSRAEYEKIELPILWERVWTKGVTMAEKVAEAFDPNWEWLGIINDDFEFITKDWDQKLLSRLDGKNFVASFDAVQRSFIKPSGVTIWSMPLLKTLGWKSFFPPGMQHLYIDDVWLNLHQRTGCGRYPISSVYIAHNHVLDGKMEQDSTFHKTYDDFFQGKSRDAGVFELYMKHDFQKDVDKILAFQDYLPGEQQNPKVFSEGVK